MRKMAFRARNSSMSSSIFMMGGGKEIRKSPDRSTGAGGVGFAGGLPHFGGADVEAVRADLEVVHFGS